MDPTRFSRFKDAIHCIANNSFLIYDILQHISVKEIEMIAAIKQALN